ncbi:DUF3422 domain-containing protein [Paucibacter sp. TC2R-5]|uniref:DUF3422 family protein n=1 Tax=Paucibacter sp. TC2R-5 TaxID=2893555 RepID=UPI0021E47DEC|nr:DUF3422 domain-containing protein [Paucibacter sp. TC2R-5]MCV2357984.1 DUF3422 domain-containing protein [Paucibacter sp. TC2R-5]
MPNSADANTAARSILPPDDGLRYLLHNEVHARPSARIHLPALIISVAVLNEGVSREAECEHLRRLPGQEGLQLDEMQGNFLRLRGDGHTVKWERHSEFTRYAIVQPLPEQALLGSQQPELMSALRVDADWLRTLPGRTVAAVKLVMLEHDISHPDEARALGQQWFGGRTVLASMMGNSEESGPGGHSVVVTNFRLAASGFERILVIAPPGTSPTRAGRISQRLLELEVYRLMALRGLPVAKDIAPVLAQAEASLAEVTLKLEGRQASESELLDTLIHVAAGVERATAQHAYRFAATQAYDTLVRQRIAELREKPIPGTQTLGEFMQRRLSPAIATVAATAQRLASLSQRIERVSALLRTRVDIATEQQNHQLLAKLTRGQDLQLNLQTTVEGLSIAAISYYVVSLLLYGAKALKSSGLPVNPEIAVGVLIPLVLWSVWRATRRVHTKLHAKLHSSD